MKVQNIGEVDCQSMRDPKQNVCIEYFDIEKMGWENSFMKLGPFSQEPIQ
jgi:hypothetical protein